MTVSEKERTENLDHAIRLLMKELADRAISQAFFSRDGEALRSVLQTTWKEMCDQGWLEEFELYGRAHYRLSGGGWIEFLWRTGAGKGKEFSERLGRLTAALKKYVKGREKDILVEFGQIVADSGLASGWVFNAIDSGAIEKLLRRHGARWQERGVLVRIPLHFGMEVLDHSADIRAELERLEEELETTKQELGEYRCPFCGAPIVSQVSVPLSEHDEGMLEAFECGYSHIDGHVQSPCPSDPKFPQLDDYDLIYQEVSGDSTWKWKCLAVGKTKEARMVTLSVGLGRTKEEAQERVVESYNRHDKPWKK